MSHRFLDKHEATVNMILSYLDDWKKHGNLEAVKAVTMGANTTFAEMVKDREEFKEFCYIWLSDELIEAGAIPYSAIEGQPLEDEIRERIVETISKSDIPALMTSIRKRIQLTSGGTTADLLMKLALDAQKVEEYLHGTVHKRGFQITSDDLISLMNCDELKGCDEHFSFIFNLQYQNKEDFE